MDAGTPGQSSPVWTPNVERNAQAPLSGATGETGAGNGCVCLLNLWQLRVNILQLGGSSMIKRVGSWVNPWEQGFFWLRG